MVRISHRRLSYSGVTALVAGCWLATLPAVAQIPTTPEPQIFSPTKASQYVLKQVVPEYPPLAKLNYIQGPVRMLVSVTREGRVSEAHILQGHPFLAVAALKAIRDWLFRPARSRSGPERFQTFVAINFALRARKIEQMPRQPEADLRRQVHPPEVLDKPMGLASVATVRLRLLVGAEGRVLDSQPLVGSARFLDEARENVSHWTFRPAHWGAMAVPWYLDVDVPVHGWSATRGAADPAAR